MKINLFTDQVHRVFFVDVNGNVGYEISEIGFFFFIKTNNEGNPSTATTPDTHPESIVGRDIFGLHDLPDLLRSPGGNGHWLDVVKHVIRFVPLNYLNFKHH